MPFEPNQDELPIVVKAGRIIAKACRLSEISEKWLGCDPIEWPAGPSWNAVEKSRDAEEGWLSTRRSLTSCGRSWDEETQGMDRTGYADPRAVLGELYVLKKTHDFISCCRGGTALFLLSDAGPYVELKASERTPLLYNARRQGALRDVERVGKLN
jgi:hypothetical protein